MPGLDDWTLQPAEVVQRIFEECGAKGPWRERIKEHFEEELKQPSVLEKLPWLNECPLHQLRAGQLVRYRCMVQDMLGKEFFSDVYEVTPDGASDGCSSRLLPGRYKDVVQCGPGENIDASGPNSQTGDRLVYYCVPVPGETDWVKQVYQEQQPHLAPASTSSGSARLKRPAVEDQAESMETEEAEGEGEERKKVRGEGWGASGSGGAGPTTASTSSTSTTSTTTPELNFPFPGMKGTPALVKIYEEESLTLNQVIEVVAILSVSPHLASSSSPSSSSIGVEEEGGVIGGDGDMETPGGHSASPASLVPRLHAILARPMAHTNPLLPADTTTTTTITTTTRDTMMKVLVEVCLGDSLAAEHLLCHLLSSVYCRQDVTVIGKYALNLSGVDGELQAAGYTPFLYGVLSSLVTQAHYLPLTLDTINKRVFVPKKDYQTDKLVSGYLQLPQHTHLLLDETQLSEGQVDRAGMANLTAIGNVITWQKVDYDFQFHTIEQLTNVPVLVMSEGKSMLPSDVEVRLQPREKNVELAKARVEALLSCPSTLSLLRIYLTAARLAPYTLTEEMQKVVQDDFMESRKDSGGEGLSAAGLHSLLVVARLVTLSYGETQLNRDLWETAKKMETERKARLPPPSSS
ncbi:mini-chromosome maintenance complex-binding protein-like [Eriocheir sinensis]|uniref:mini-chromosome maintenance complex-binding protein-like n=1 Tax=Eriocheir sinensis TaxID=95602 RepID=UPI0021C9CD27|nr:mini-chromosome maintenance complex-binding protein-like [Eriocheir sinensis]